MAHHVIYVPGLGDDRKFGQPVILLWWRLFGVKTHYYAVQWKNSESFDKKLQKLLIKIDRLQKTYGAVSLVGVSAGATAALNAYALRKDIKSVVCICGKINNPQTVGQRVYDINPPFKESIYMLQANLKQLGTIERNRIMSIHPLQDPTVPPADTIIKEAVEITIPTNGHIFSIYYSLMFRARTICKFLKNTQLH